MNNLKSTETKPAAPGQRDRQETELKQMERNCVVHSYARFDILLERGEGATCWDDQGKQYIDLTAGIGVNCLGFSDPEWSAAIAGQAAKLQHTSNLYYTEPMIRLASSLTKRTGMSKVFFANSGAEANECAIKAARKYGNQRSGNTKNQIITLKNAFHGRTVSTITATGQEQYHKNFFPFDSGFTYCTANDMEELTSMISGNSCAVMMELIQGEGGVLVIDPAFAKAAEQLCREHDMLLIIDEVQTGIGRTGSFFCYQQYGLHPDIVTFAKGIGAGLPLGGALFNDRTADVLEPGDHGTTFGGNPVVCAGANVVMNRMNDLFLEEVQKKGQYIADRLDQIPAVYDRTGLGMMLGFRVKDQDAGDVVKKGIAHGLLMLTAKDKVRLLPPLTISVKELQESMHILEEILK